MQLSAHAVNWAAVVALLKEGRLTEVMGSDDAESLHAGEAPWPSDSCVQYSEVAEAYQAIRARVSPATRAAADQIMASLINEDFRFPADLGADVDPDWIAGSIAPQRVKELLRLFAQLDYADLDRAFDRGLSHEQRQALRICELGPSQKVFTGYLRQWQNLLKHAGDRDAGVLLHMG